jgi:hypothetical protein
VEGLVVHLAIKLEVLVVLAVEVLVEVHTPEGLGLLGKVTLEESEQVVVEQVPGGVSVVRGPLVYVLPFTEAWAPTASFAFEAKDWVVTSDDPFNYALIPGVFDFRSFVTQQPPFASGAPRQTITARARRLHSWVSSDGGFTADMPPVSPACGGTGECGPVEEIVLVPMGNARLRITVFPWTGDATT